MKRWLVPAAAVAAAVLALSGCGRLGPRRAAGSPPGVTAPATGAVAPPAAVTAVTGGTGASGTAGDTGADLSTVDRQLSTVDNQLAQADQAADADN